ncbi:hypothetical protein MLD38_003497 [Melastoma candidum]|uniref:Uncharacterized protein n=1 Tax=Melastoma candidum TaxID=119954 RepID=A0ACB9S3G1_9MYRT|nr:hypothetical protein MLD38_003497 [Melastoma candidum]
MAKLFSYSGRKKNNRLPKLKNVVEKIQKSLTLRGRLSSSFGSSSRCSWETNDCDHEEFDGEGYKDVPEDVKEGHFAVIASQGKEPKRFVIPITYLLNPNFLRLLEEAAEEYGFDHMGALPIPCLPSELEKILTP